MKNVSWKWIVTLFCSIAFVACTSDSPSAVAEKAFKYAQEQQFDKYVDLVYVNPETGVDEVAKEKERLVALLKAFAEEMDEQDKVSGFSVVSEDIDENEGSAVVKMEVVYESGKKETEITRLKKDENGNWKIKNAK